MGLIIACLKEVKNNENRVGLTPKGVKELVDRGHKVIVQTSAGEGSGFMNEEYTDAGAELMDSPEEMAQACDILVKVKEPIPAEYPLLDLMKGKTIYTYFHLSGVDKNLTLKLLENQITAVAYETVQDESGKLPLLAPMSEIAGVLAVQYGAQYLQKKYNGYGVTLGVIRNTDKAHTVIVGGGFVGEISAKTAAGMGGRVTILDINPDRVEELKGILRDWLGENLYQNVEVKVSDAEVLAEAVKDADLLIGGVLVPGARAPKVVTEEHVKSMKKGAVIVDVAIDQGGCVWGSKATTHDEPIFEIDGKVFCCVANMPGQVSRQSTQALTSATLPYLLKMADSGVIESIKTSLGADGRFAQGINTMRGKITYKSVAEDLELTDQYAELGTMME